MRCSTIGLIEITLTDSGCRGKSAIIPNVNRHPVMTWYPNHLALAQWPPRLFQWPVWQLSGRRLFQVAAVFQMLSEDLCDFLAWPPRNREPREH
jgi:hypothetical protein